MPVCQVRMPGMRMRPSGSGMVQQQVNTTHHLFEPEQEERYPKGIAKKKKVIKENVRTYQVPFGIELLSFIPTLPFYCNLHKGERTKVK